MNTYNIFSNNKENLDMFIQDLLTNNLINILNQRDNMCIVEYLGNDELVSNDSSVIVIKMSTTPLGE